MAQTIASQLGSDAIAHPPPTSDIDPSPSLHHLRTEPQADDTQLGSLAIAPPQVRVQDQDDLEFADLPPFPTDVPCAPILRIELDKLLNEDQTEIDRLWKACCGFGFFYLDLRNAKEFDASTGDSQTEDDVVQDAWRDHEKADSPIESSEAKKLGTDASLKDRDVPIDAGQLLSHAEALFNVGEKVFELPVEEKLKYDYKAMGGYFGYKGYGQGVIDSKGTQDRNEFYNVSKDDILGISDPLPGPDVLNPYRNLARSYIEQSHSVISLVLRLLNDRLGLPKGTLSSLHRLRAVSGDQVRWVKSPPQPDDDQRTALGEHTDFGSVTVLFNRLGGLQVLPPDSDQWCYVKPLRGHAVVNLGDAMVKFTAGILRSNIHRVVNPPGEQAKGTRMSLVYFARPEDSVILKTLSGSELIDEKKKSDGSTEPEEEVTAKDWILRRALARRTGGNYADSKGTEGERLGK